MLTKQCFRLTHGKCAKILLNVLCWSIHNLFSLFPHPVSRLPFILTEPEIILKIDSTNQCTTKPIPNAEPFVNLHVLIPS